jgi:hypothetical protein
MAHQSRIPAFICGFNFLPVLKTAANREAGGNSQCEFSVTDTALSTDILDTFAVASGFAGYDMTTPLGPVSGGAAYSVNTLFPTSVGNFEFTKTGGGVSTVSAVPEPSSLFLIALGLSGLAAHRTSRRVRTRS